MGIRTPDLRLRRAALYPAELQTRIQTLRSIAYYEGSRHRLWTKRFLCARRSPRRARRCAAGEIPVGAVVVRGGEIIGRGRNARAARSSPLAHAEIEAMRDAAKNINSWRFDGCALYVTLEPCVMCAGALVQCRMGSIVFGAKDPKAGGCVSLYAIPRDPRMYHRCRVTGGLLADECAALLTEFFAAKRRKA